jgi:hypothetical protein
MDLSTLRHQIELGTVRTFGQFRNAIVQIFSNAVMFNRTGYLFAPYSQIVFFGSKIHKKNP